MASTIVNDGATRHSPAEGQSDPKADVSTDINDLMQAHGAIDVWIRVAGASEAHSHNRCSGLQISALAIHERLEEIANNLPNNVDSIGVYKSANLFGMIDELLWNVQSDGEPAEIGAASLVHTAGLAMLIIEQQIEELRRGK